MKALIIMSKAPIPGLSKTRLKSILTDDECSKLQYSMLKDLFITTEKLKEDIDIFLFYTPKNYLELMKKISPDYITLYPQEGETIGDRMYNAAEFILKKYDEVIIIGSDIPEINHGIIFDAFERLEKYDVVIGPTYDGGYYLIGLKKLNKGIFNGNIPWGGKSVLELTINNIIECKLTYDLVEKCFDIDTRDDLLDFIKRNLNNSIAKHTYQYIISIGGKNGERFNDKQDW